MLKQYCIQTRIIIRPPKHDFCVMSRVKGAIKIKILRLEIIEDKDRRILIKLCQQILLNFQFEKPYTCTQLEEQVNLRIQHLENLIQNTKYSKQKDALKDELCRVLESQEPPMSLSNATPSSVRMFLGLKDLKGKTVIHEPHCSRNNCNCPSRRSA